MEYIRMRELNKSEIKQVSGGYLPLIAAAYSIATGTAVRSFTGYVLNRAATTYAIYSAASHYGSGGGLKQLLND
jgi:multisubunit Na+/H+ antiporter MnhB subunit